MEQQIIYRNFGAEPSRPSAAVLERLRGIPAAVLADVAGGWKALSGRIAPLAQSMRMAGPAFTVEVVPGDNLMVHAAIALAKPGDIVVVDGKGDLACSLIGSIMTTTAIERGIGGLVVDGAVRDVDELRALGLPIYAAGTCPNGPTKRTAGRINVPVSVGGRIVRPGDLVVGDADGVVSLEADGIERLLDLADRKIVDENDRIAELRRGENLAPPWLVGALRAAGLVDA